MGQKQELFYSFITFFVIVIKLNDWIHWIELKIENRIESIWELNQINLRIESNQFENRIESNQFKNRIKLRCCESESNHIGLFILNKNYEKNVKSRSEVPNGYRVVGNFHHDFCFPDFFPHWLSWSSS